MNNTFSFKRFGWLLREILVERWVYFTGLFVIIAVGQLLLGLTATNAIFFSIVQNFRLIGGALLGITAVVAVLIKRYQRDQNGVRNLLIPASNIEKWSSVVVAVFVLFWAIYLSVFFITDTIIYKVAMVKAEKIGDVSSINYLSNFSFGRWFLEILYTVILLVSFFAAWVMVSSTYLRKNILPISIIAFALCCIAGFTLNWLLAQSLFQNPISYGQATPFYNVVVGKKLATMNELSLIELTHSATKSVLLFHFVLPILLVAAWVIYYFRLKETEI